MYWTIQNLGLGNIALIRQADARLQINQYQQVELLNMVRADIAEAYARSHARYAQIGDVRGGRPLGLPGVPRGPGPDPADGRGRGHDAACCRSSC